MRFYKYADVAELADALDSGSSESNFMWVQVPSSAPALSSRKVTELFFVSVYKIQNQKPPLTVALITIL